MAKRTKKRGRHSPAGYAWLMEQAAKTKPVYFKGIRQPTVESRLQQAGLSTSDIKRLKRKR